MKEEIELLKQASGEIKQLRKENELMGARLDMFDKMMTLFHTEPNRRGKGMSPDLVFEIDKFIADNPTKSS